MRVSIVHDSAGNITGIIAGQSDAPMAYLEPRPGEHIAEVEAPELEGDLTEEETSTRLAGIVERYRIDVTANSTLQRKS